MGEKGLIGKSYGHELVRKYSSFFHLVENDFEDIVQKPVELSSALVMYSFMRCRHVAILVGTRTGLVLAVVLESR